MPKYAVEIDDDVRDVLQRSTITEASLMLPSEQLERKLYERVNKVLIAAGGKWNKKARAHLFDRDPRQALGLALENGSITDTKKAQQQFFTPPVLAAQIALKATIRPGLTVLEPSAGEGALALAARRLGADVCCIEQDQHCINALLKLGFPVTGADFLNVPATAVMDRVLMNPPFTKGQDVAHVMHALQFVKPGGRLVAIMSAGVKSNRQAKRFRGVCEEFGVEIEDLPEDAFLESGTGVRTVLVVVDVP